MASAAQTDWCFEPSNTDLDQVNGLTNFAKILLSKLIHVMLLGLYFHNAKNIPRQPLDVSTPAGKACQKFVMKVMGSWTASDTFFPLRRTAPSLSLITEYLSVGSKMSSKSIFAICILRTFGVGSKDNINSLVKVLAIHDDDTVKPDLGALETTIQTQGVGQLKITRGVYGQLQIVRASVASMLAKFWDFAEEVVKLRGAGADTLEFEHLLERLCRFNIPTVPRGGLLSWLIISDLVEYEICKAPNIELLAEHMGLKKTGKGKGPSGPGKSFKIVEAEHKNMGVDEGVREDYGAALSSVWNVLTSPPAGVTWLQNLLEDCRVAQDRPVTVVDLEHFLCKITRYAGKAT